MFQRCDSKFKQFCLKELRESSFERENGKTDIKKLMQVVEQNSFMNQHMFAPKEDYQQNLVALCEKIYDLARYSLDLPLSSSVAAHSFVFIDALQFSNQHDALMQFRKDILNNKKIGAICNSEYGAGSNLKKIQSVLSKENIFTIDKPHITNGSIADLGLFSVYDESQDSERMSVFLMSLNKKNRYDVNSKMSYFTSGSVGGINFKRAFNEGDDYKLEKVSSFQLLRRCFDTERLILGVMAAGLLRGLQDEIEQAISSHSNLLAKTSQYQYLQEKIVNLIRNRLTLESLIEKVIVNMKYDYTEFNDHLSTLKLLATEQGFNSALEAMEFFGARASLVDSHFQKTTRDLLAYRFFGGTKELHKNAIFQNFSKNIKEKSEKKVA